MDHVIHTTLGQGRRVALSAELCRQYGLRPGSPVVLESTDGGIMIRPLERVIEEVQSFFAENLPSGTGLSEELIRERDPRGSQDSDV